MHEGSGCCRGHCCRCWPPVTPLVGLQREAAAATHIGGYRLPAGEKVWINVFAIHHDERYWPEPEVMHLAHCTNTLRQPRNESQISPVHLVMIYHTAQVAAVSKSLLAVLQCTSSITAYYR